MTLLGAVAAHLRARGTGFALIGAGALAVHGVARSTRDLDLLVLDRPCLAPAYWEPLERAGIRVVIREGGLDDPLAGVVRLARDGSSPIDVIVAQARWQQRVIDDAMATVVEGAEVPVATRVDLILLKLYAGGPQDAWDVQQLLDTPDRATIEAEVTRCLDTLPADARRLWTRVLEG
jgi:predicted nucleotidyltransferase